MKKAFFTILCLSIAFVSCKTEKKEVKPEVETTEVKEEVVIADAVYKVNAEASVLKWEGFKPAESHYGELKVQEGSFKVKEGKLVSGKFVMDMASISVTDIPVESEYNGKLVGHLKNDDFFSVEKFPTSTFEITNVEGDKVKGNLTIKNITKPVEFTAKLVETEAGVELTAEPFKIDRTEYDIKYKSTKFFENLADKFIKDEFEISFSLKAAK